MREIKFRVWDKIDEKIREVTLIDFEYKKVKLLNDYTDESYLRDFEEVILLEYTGLKDKNDKELKGFIKDLSIIMGALIDKSIGIRHMIEIKDYVSKEELESLKRQAKIVDKIANKVSKLINS